LSVDHCKQFLLSKPSFTIVVVTRQAEIVHETKSIKTRLTMKTLAKIHMPSIDITKSQHANKKIEKKVAKNANLLMQNFLQTIRNWQQAFDDMWKMVTFFKNQNFPNLLGDYWVNKGHKVMCKNLHM